ncbi:MAG TPA: hypothetical protein VMZ27_06665 [Candidatus Saccharimonadales bacterium]|nr:hypothetical protein [Candidatus Saccharimonadales bacterium]
MRKTFTSMQHGRQRIWLLVATMVARGRVRSQYLTRLASLCVVAFGVAALEARAQPYAVNWYKIAGGGGTSTGSLFAVSGTIGQHDAGGPLTGGGFSVTGGFWALYAVQTAGAPTLTIRLTSTNTALIHWPSPSTGFNLQVSTNMPASNWTIPPETLNDTGTLKFIVVNPAAGSRFYRLIKP